MAGEFNHQDARAQSFLRGMLVLVLRAPDRAKWCHPLDSNSSSELSLTEIGQFAFITPCHI
jgi:hypothetical protein